MKIELDKDEVEFLRLLVKQRLNSVSAEEKTIINQSPEFLKDETQYELLMKGILKKLR